MGNKEKPMKTKAEIKEKIKDISQIIAQNKADLKLPESDKEDLERDITILCNRKIMLEWVLK